ncbi:MAG: hypothetical protein NT052_00425 [Candidatus Shapirobacteria bacterium]|nr:hypothetical protein [Candidatus Shapirobacteria bacterium]
MSQCLAVKKSILEKTDFWSRFPRKDEKIRGSLSLIPEEINNFLEIIDNNKKFKERRGENGIEDKPEYQQIIFYGLIRQGEKFFVYQRGGGNNSQYKETRLQSKISVGIGGHIEPFDNGLIDSLYREFDEEVILKKNNQIVNLRNEKGEINKELFNQLAEIKVLGLIKDETGEVEEVHMGLIAEIKLLSLELSIEIRDHEENINGQMMSLEEYQSWIGQGEVVPEEWTKIVINDFLV